MTTPLSRLGIDRWSVEDRLSLIEAIWDTLDAELADQPLTDDQRREVDRRLAAHGANPEAAVPWDQVEAAAPARLRR